MNKAFEWIIFIHFWTHFIFVNQSTVQLSLLSNAKAHFNLSAGHFFFFYINKFYLKIVYISDYIFYIKLSGFQLIPICQKITTNPRQIHPFIIIWCHLDQGGELYSKPPSPYINPYKNWYQINHTCVHNKLPLKWKKNIVRVPGLEMDTKFEHLKTKMFIFENFTNIYS